MKSALVVFDLAGTTVEDNPDVQRVLLETMRRFNVTITMEEAASVMGIPKPVAILQLLRSGKAANEISTSLVNEIHRKFVQNMVSFYQHDISVREKSGVGETFEFLK